MASNVTLREYASLAVTYGKVIQAPAEPGTADQNITSGVGSTQSAAFSLPGKRWPVTGPHRKSKLFRET